ncbi:MAG: RnfABCDGE type electron transport complex subunit D [Kiritimatiellae bacterium]|nr:RnfABCDGE type electron transport complex subunit D [Kiritimatiellia bacterium]
MRRVLLALLPCAGGAVYFFGWRSLALALGACAIGFLVEFAFCRRRREPVSEAVFVTGLLYTLALPPTVPWHVLLIGMAFAVIFAKEAFGGFGRNIFNPALAGRCFVYVCFPTALTATWAPPAAGGAGALAQWTTAGAVDAVTSATPLALLKAGQAPAPPVQDLLFGRIAGSMGVTSALLILIGGLYLLLSRTARWGTALSLVISYAALCELLHRLGVRPVPPAAVAVLGGGFLFGALFMATDPVSSPSTRAGRVICGILIAVCTLVIRNFSVFNGGLMFAILLGNMFGPIIDYAVLQAKRRGEVPA